jgi:hypothetical protein
VHFDSVVFAAADQPIRVRRGSRYRVMAVFVIQSTP